jgi:hypothetical protein
MCDFFNSHNFGQSIDEKKKKRTRSIITGRAQDGHGQKTTSVGLPLLYTKFLVIATSLDITVTFLLYLLVV